MVRAYGTQACFERLSHAAPETGSTIIQAGTNATDLCGCVGELFATGFIAAAFDAEKVKDMTPGSQASKLFDSYNTICLGRLRPPVR